MTDKSKILIVDDEPLNVKLIAAILTSENYEISLAYNGKQALEKVDADCPDLIILDIMMPDIDGFEVTRKLKANHKTKDIPIILITASDAADFKVIGHEAGADEFLNKPINILELKSRVQSLIHTKSYLDELTLKKQSGGDKNPYGEYRIPYSDSEAKSVLLVSEDEHSANIVQMYLNNQPYRMYARKTVQEAIEYVETSKIDLILFELSQGNGQSLAVCDSIKDKMQATNVQMLVISDLEYLEKNHEQFEIWADDFLIKPINVHEIRLRVKALLKKKSYLDKLDNNTQERVQSAIIDKLSGLANRSYFEYFLEQEIKRSLRDGRSIALLLIDLNGVIINSYGSENMTKEKLIKPVGAIIKEKIREIDLGARLRDNQFAAVLVNTDHLGAKVVSERLEAGIQAYLSSCSGSTTAKEKLTFGIAVYPADADSMDRLIRQAEKKMTLFDSQYQAPIHRN